MPNIICICLWVHVTKQTEADSVKAQLADQAGATAVANRKNKELEDEIVKLNERLAIQEAESEKKMEQKLKQYREEDNKKIEALRQELMVAFRGGGGTSSVQVQLCWI